MKKMMIKSTTHNYPIYVGQELLKNISLYLDIDYTKIFIITDENVAKLYVKEVESALDNFPVLTKVIDSGEQSKSIETYYEIQSFALANALDRNSLIIALGGGVVGDLAGFVAATFMRGIDYIQVPTTILAHDSSVGGKVAINHELGKNLIGSFYSPKAVIYDLSTLNSLPAAEIRSGYAEIIKESLIGNKLLYKEIMNINLKELSTLNMQEHIYEGIRVKKKIVEADEKESSQRMYLNLGHTLGHAIEILYAKKPILHGEAIATGLLFSLFVSEREYKVDLGVNRLYRWLDENDYPIYVPEEIDLILDKMKQDKKNRDGRITLILVKDIGEIRIESFTEEHISLLLKDFIKSLSGGFND